MRDLIMSHLSHFWRYLRSLWDQLDDDTLSDFLRSSDPLAVEFREKWAICDDKAVSCMRGEVSFEMFLRSLEELRQIVSKIYHRVRKLKKWTEV